MASTSCVKQSQVHLKEPTMNNLLYPAPLASYEDVVADPKLFMATLEKLHASMGTKFMIPVIGGKELDLHCLFMEVTSRGGIEKVIREKRWKEVTAIFNFPSTATNASFVLRKYYGSLLFHYEQIYYFKSWEWTSRLAAPLQSPVQVPAQVTVQPSSKYQAATIQQQHSNSIEPGGARSALLDSSPVIGIIDGKFDGGYLVTVTVGSEKLKGVLYQAPHNQSCQLPQHVSVSAINSDNARASLGMQRRRRRKRSGIKRRDPAHPKPNRSGYNFFFAEQHARLKPLHPGKDREISRMIGELWNKLNESDKAIYQGKAIEDKERYRTEMEDYRERLRTGQVISNAVPLQQCLPEEDIHMVEVDVKDDETGESDSEDDKTAEKDAEPAADSAVGLSSDSGNVAAEATEAGVFVLSKG